jgi:hypothetical protein
MRERPNTGQTVKYRPLLGGPMLTAKNAPCAPSGARPERLVSDLISLPGAFVPGGARNGGGSASGSAGIRPGLALGWEAVTARLAAGRALGRALGWAARNGAGLGWALADRPGLESRLVPDGLAPSLRVRFLSAFPCAPVSASLAPIGVGLVPFRSALGCGEAVAPLTGGTGSRT